jgi:hypothetical protein
MLSLARLSRRIQPEPHLPASSSPARAPYRLMNKDESALQIHSAATMGKMIDVFPVWSMKRPIKGSPSPAQA